MNVICVINIECVITNYTQFYVLYEDPFHVLFVNTVFLLRFYGKLTYKRY